VVTRRAWLAGAAAAGTALIGCASGEPDSRPGPPVRDRDALLTPWLSINGGWRVASTQPTLVQPPKPAARVTLLHPVGVAVRGDTVIIADAGRNTLWRYDRTRDAIVALGPFSGHSADHGVSMQVGTDYGIWIALPAEHAVVQLDSGGRVVRRLRDDVNAPRPVAVALWLERGQVLVGDAATASVVAFDRFGKAFRFHRSGDTPLQSVAAMHWGPLGLYVLDRAAQQVVVLGPGGQVVDLAGDESLVHPRAIAVDASGRIFVADEADQRIKVFRGRELIGTYGGTGQFGRIEALALDANLLYVADSVNARVQVLLVAPPSMERPVGRRIGD
jgi:hypothetical protein